MRQERLLWVLLLFQVACSSPYLRHQEPERLSIDDGMPDIHIKELGDDPNMSYIEPGAVEGAPSYAVESVPQKQGEEKADRTRRRGGKRVGPGPGAPPPGDSKKDLQRDSQKALRKEGSPKAKKEELVQRASPGIPPQTEDPKLLPVPVGPVLRLPEYEDQMGFSNGSRRPDRDPFRVGERVVLSVRYFKAQAGEMALEVKPFVEVDGRKSYRWYTSLKTTGMFSKFYSIDDWAETLVDYQTLMPSVFNLHVVESGQLRNGRGYFNADTLEGLYVEKKFTEKRGHQEKKQKWTILPYSQNVFSAAFYMRVFNFEVGKEYRFTVSDDEQNLTFRGKALRKESIQTDAGLFKTIVVKPEFELNGVFRPVGDIFFWLTDDDRKLIIKIESEIKIGTLVMEAISVETGRSE